MYSGEFKAAGIGKRFLQDFEDRCIAGKDLINTHPTMKYTPKRIEDFSNEGLLILNTVRKKIVSGAWKKWKFIAYEHLLMEPISEEFCKLKDDRETIMVEGKTIPNEMYQKGPLFKGYIDLIVEDEDGNHLLIDLKTATRPWDKYAKGDVIKKAQLKLYKYFYSQQSGIPLEKIRTMFVILPRQQSKTHYQEIEHKFGNRALLNEMQLLNKFFTSVYKIKKYFPIASFKSCRWCSFKNSKYCSVKY